MTKMSNSESIDEARRLFAIAEKDYRTGKGLEHLEAAIALLEEAALSSDPAQTSLASNLAATYARKICTSVQQLVAGDAGVPEPELEHLFRVLLAFDSDTVELPGFVRELKVDVVKQLIDRYCEGFPAEQREALLAQLADLSSG